MSFSGDMPLTDIDAIAFALARIFHTPLGQLRAEVEEHRAEHGGPSLAIVGSKAGGWANQAADYALTTDAPYVATAYMRHPQGHIYDLSSRWVVYAMRTRQALDDWYGSLVGKRDRYQYLAAFDKTAPEWNQSRPVASAVSDPDALVGEAPPVFDPTFGPGRVFIPAHPSPREQLQHLDQLVAAHETYWAAVAQSNPQSSVMREFLRRYWDPWYTGYQLSRARDAGGLPFVHAASQGLSSLRAFAAQRGIPTPDLETAAATVAGDEGARQMSEYTDGSGGSYPEVAARAVASAQRQSPSPIYGYLRAGVQQHVYLFHTLEDGQGWFAALVHGQAQPYDYAAVFASTDVSRPVAGLESFGHTVVSGDAAVGSVLPFLLGLPFGGLAGYYLRRWQEENPGHALPGITPGKLPAPIIPPPKASGDYIGGPWLDIEQVGSPYVGGPWLDIESRVGADLDAEAGVINEELDALAQVLAETYGLPLEQTRAEIMALARSEAMSLTHGMNVGVGGPWLDIASPYDDPWLASRASPSHARFADAVGASYGSSRYERYERPRVHVESDVERKRRWPETRALIEAAKREVAGYQASYPAAAWVWSLDPSGEAFTPGVQLTGGTTVVTPFSSPDQALDYMRSRIQTPHVALALFDTASPHWPNPVNWTKSDDPAYAPVIAQRVAETRAAGHYVGSDDPARDVWNQPRPVLRGRGARVAQHAHGRTGARYLGVELFGPAAQGPGIRNDDYRGFPTLDAASDWLTAAPGVVIYRAIYDATDPTWPAPISELFGDPKMSKMIGAWGAGTSIGSALGDVRGKAESLAARRAGNVVGVIHTSRDGLWHSLAFRSADDADDWLNTATQDPAAYTYAAYFDKGGDSWPHAYIEKISGMRGAPGAELPRRSTTTSGDRPRPRRFGWAA